MVYFIASNSYHVRLEEILKIFKSLDDVEVIDCNDTNLVEIVHLCSYTSLFDDHKKILVKNCNFLDSKKDNDLDILEKYIENPNPLTDVIFLFNDKVDERKKIVKTLKDKNQFIYIKPLGYKDINAKLISKAKSEGYKLNESNASYITFASLSNYDIAILQLEKVMLYYNEPCEIKRDDLENLVSQSLEDNNFKFVDAVIKRDVRLAMQLIKDFKLFKIEPIVLISLLAREYRLMLFAKHLQEKGFNNSEIGKKLGLQDWQVDKTINNSYHYVASDLENKLIDLLDLDFKLKSNNMDKYLALELFVLAI